MTVRNKVNWTIEAERYALLIHDMQPHHLAALSPELPWIIDRLEMLQQRLQARLRQALQDDQAHSGDPT